MTFKYNTFLAENKKNHLHFRTNQNRRDARRFGKIKKKNLQDYKTSNQLGDSMASKRQSWRQHATDYTKAVTRGFMYYFIWQ